MLAAIQFQRQRFARLLAPVAGRYALALGALGVATLLTFAAPLATALGIDLLTERFGTRAGAGASANAPTWLAPLSKRLAEYDTTTALVAAAAAALAFTLLAGYLQYLRGRLVGEAGETVAKQLRDRLHAHILRLPSSYLGSHEHGDLVQRCTSDVETARAFVGAQLPEVARTAAMVAVALPLLISLDPLYALVATALYPVIVAFALYFFRRVRALFQAVDECEGRLTAVIQENLTGVRVVRAFAAADHERKKFRVANAEFRDRTGEWIDKLGTFWAGSDALCVGQMLIVLAFGGFEVRSGAMSVGLFFTFVTTSSLSIWPVRQIGRVLSDLGRASVALDRVFEVLDEPTERGGSVPLERARRVEVKGLEFGYADGDAVLHAFDLVLERGRTVALVGPPGSGKSSLIEALLASHPYRAGSILIDGHELTALDPAWVRRQFALVAQQPFLFSRSISQNLDLARTSTNPIDLEHACQQASIHVSIAGFRDGYETVVGERGVDLSGGQRQRVSLARALLFDAPFLVLDDVLSAVDTATERAISAALERERERRGVLLVTHRLSAARHADEIVVLERGRVVERGTHIELLALGGQYANTYADQSDSGEGTA